MARNYIVADVGGTHIRTALFKDQSHQPSSIKKILTKGSDSPLDRLIGLIESIHPKDDELTAIAILAPGPLNPTEGIVYEAPNIPSWCNLPLKKIIQEHFKVPVAIANDAKAAALGEWRYGAGIGHHNLVYITVSTGIGGGVIVDDRLLLGVNGLATELGHVTLIPNGPVCSCGQRGHLEAISSGPAIARWVEQEIKSGMSTSLPSDHALSAKDVATAAHQGDKLALAALARGGTYLGIALANYLHIFNPSIIIIGGGVSQSGKPFFDPLQVAMSEHVMEKKYLENLILTTCTLGDDVGLIGALVLAHTLENPDPCQ
jgi:glucokinase